MLDIVWRARPEQRVALHELPETLLELAEAVRCVVDAAADRRVHGVAAAGQDLGQERLRRVLARSLVVDEDLGEGDLRDVLAGVEPEILVARKRWDAAEAVALEQHGRRTQHQMQMLRMRDERSED